MRIAYRKNQEKTFKNNSPSPSSSFSSVKSLTTEKEFIEIEIEKSCSTYSENHCIVCRSSQNRNRIADEARFDAFCNKNLFIPPNTRCCKRHYLNNTLYTDCYRNISIVSNTSLIEINDLMWLLNKSTALRKNNLLSSFNDRSITSDGCKSVTGLTKDQFFDLKLSSLNDSKN